MIICIDIGNTETTIGIFEGKRLVHTFRFETKHRETADEVAVDLNGLFQLKNLSFGSVEGIAISSVVPRITQVYLQMASRYMPDVPIVNVEPGVKTGVHILYDNPREIGADRVADVVGCLSEYGVPAVIVDFGTATTFDVVSAKGEYVGGIIYPGIMVSAEALFSKAARLSQVELVKPARLVGKNTVESLQSGLIFGTAAMVDGIVRKIKKEIGRDALAVATGGLCFLMKGISEEIAVYDESLTLKGLRQIFELNS
jgi:type III pantothenate kinase